MIYLTRAIKRYKMKDEILTYIRKYRKEEAVSMRQLKKEVRNLDMKPTLKNMYKMLFGEDVYYELINRL